MLCIDLIVMLMQEALDAIYDSQIPTSTSSVAAANRIQGE
jgi:hypothetical protein